MEILDDGSEQTAFKLKDVAHEYLAGAQDPRHGTQLDLAVVSSGKAVTETAGVKAVVTFRTVVRHSTHSIKRSKNDKN